jgi:hypothetical protein
MVKKMGCRLQEVVGGRTSLVRVAPWGPWLRRGVPGGRDSTQQGGARQGGVETGGHKRLG